MPVVAISGDGGDLIEAYLARPLGPDPVGSVLAGWLAAVTDTGTRKKSRVSRQKEQTEPADSLARLRNR